MKVYEIYMKRKMKETRLAVRRLFENRGAMPLNNIPDIFSSSQELNSLIDAITEGYIIRNSERIYLHPELCYSIMREEALE